MQIRGLANRVRGGGTAAVGVDGLLIGDRERVVPCPRCARPLADGQGRCPGCGTLLIAGIRLRAAGFLILVGCALGMIGGALVAGAAMAPRLAAGDAAIAAAADAPTRPMSATDQALPAAPALVADPGAAEPAPPTPPAAPVPGAELPAGVMAGLLEVAAVNDRLTAAATELDTALGTGSRRAVEIPVLLRRIAADVRSGTEAARRIESWAPARELAAAAIGLYAAIRSTATDGLAAPLADRTAYAGAGRAVRSALAGLPAVVAATRDAARRAGVDLPAAALP
jgi:hypothetical protein